jgi:hypothetical protein
LGGDVLYHNHRFIFQNSKKEKEINCEKLCAATKAKVNSRQEEKGEAAGKKA